MKCIILLFSFVALCYSYPYGNTWGRSVNIGEDGTITIKEANGKQVMIEKKIGASGQKNIEITVSGPNIATKRIQINDQNEVRDANLLGGGRGREAEFNVGDEYQRDKRSSKKHSQSETLSQILGEYQGIDVDDDAYEQLLRKVSSAVRSGLVSEAVYDILQNLNQRQYPGDVKAVVTGQGLNVLDLLQRQQQMDALLQQLNQQQQFQWGQGGAWSTLGQQQIAQPYGQRIGSNLYGIRGGGVDTTLQRVVLDVPVEDAGVQIVEKVLLAQPQVNPNPMTQGVVYGPRGIGVRNYGILGSSRGQQRSIWENLLNNFGTQQGGISWIPYGQQETSSRIVQNERAILEQQDQIQQQQAQQQLQQQQQQILQQQQQQQLLQQLQQLQQQQQLQQEQLQQQVWQGQQYNPLTTYVLSRPVATRTQQGRVLQPLSVSQQGSLTGVTNWQGIPITQTNVPLVL